MKELKELLRACRQSPERIDYHPEKWLGRHIALVCLRVLLMKPKPTLMMAALLHDVMKPVVNDKLQVKNEYGWEYISNPNHAELAADYIKYNYDINQWIRFYGANVEQVEKLVRYHMSVKESLKNKYKSIAFIDLFRIFDDMIDRFDFPTREGKHQLLNEYDTGNLIWIGQSPIQRDRLKDEFTITIDRNIHVYKFESIPGFFVDTEFEYLYHYIKLLV